jgi:hypothetical protein
MPPDLNYSRTGDGTSPSRRPPAKLPTIDRSAICLDETAALAPDGEAAIASVAGEVDDHRRNAVGEGQTSRELDVRARSAIGIGHDPMAASAAPGMYAAC